MTPAVSVIMPVHNRAAALPRAIASVLGQTFANFELIVVDDGSNDGSANLAESNADDRIRVIRLTENLGANAARNAGVRAARAPLISFLDSDDIYLPNKLEQVVAEFERRPKLDLLVDSFVKIQGPEALLKRVVRRNLKIEDSATFERALFTRVLWKATPAITVRREAIERAGMFDESLKRMQDFDFLARACATAQCAAIPDVLWVKHWDAGAISVQDSLIPAGIEIARRFPQQLSRRANRPGIAYLLRLSLWRRLLSANVGGAVRDVRQLAAAFGRREAVKLLFEACFPRPRLRS